MVNQIRGLIIAALCVVTIIAVVHALNGCGGTEEDTTAPALVSVPLPVPVETIRIVQPEPFTCPVCPAFEEEEGDQVCVTITQVNCECKHEKKICHSHHGREVCNIIRIGCVCEPEDVEVCRELVSE